MLRKQRRFDRKNVALAHNLRSGALVALAEVSGEPSRDGHAESSHAVEHLAADPGLDLLCGQSPGAERSAEDDLVAQIPIGLRIRTSRHDGASARCSVSNRPDQPNASCLFTPPSKTLSTSSAISPPAARFASSETKRSGRGEPQPWPEPHLGLPIFARPNSVRVTGPSRAMVGAGRGRDPPAPHRLL